MILVTTVKRRPWLNSGDRNRSGRKADKTAAEQKYLKSGVRVYAKRRRFSNKGEKVGEPKRERVRIKKNQAEKKKRSIDQIRI